MIAVAQMIDSLETGGAEAMAINLANELSRQEGYVSYLIVSRGREGFGGRILPEVKLVLLNKRNRFDLIAIMKLINLLKDKHINIVHAHSTSFFVALIAALFVSFKLVWHDHHGGKIANLHPYMKAIWAKRFDAILCASEPLANLSLSMIGNKNIDVSSFPNFIPNCNHSNQRFQIEMQGQGLFTILCVANFRPQKDHLNLLRALRILQDRQINFKAVLSGFVYDEKYYNLVMKEIEESQLHDRISIITNSSEVNQLIENADLGVISSSSEGMPLVLLEYGCHSLPVVSTAVGEISKSFDENMLWMVPPENSQLLADALMDSIKNEQSRKRKASLLHLKVNHDFGAERAMKKLNQLYQSLLP